ncbi:MAG TPA: hypothetical protein VLA48_05290 [Nitrososphaeraceae archaeon]|nr:hypothetical protein [Nitrososphaeraceae archaeon]
MVSGNTLQEVQTFFPNLLAPIPLQLFDSYNHYAMQFEFIVSFSFQEQQTLSLISLHSKTILVGGFGILLSLGVK